MIIISGIILLIIGACLGYQVAYFPKLKNCNKGVRYKLISI
ncbi:Uncharacterised protein [Enterococcus hirae]|nr:Uncharacterised protein [Enterococcus hirae]